MFNIAEVQKKITSEFLDNLLVQHKVYGCSIGLYTKKIRLYINAGTRNTVDSVTEDTSFRVASLTKPVFAYIVHNLVLDGKIDLDSPLINYYGKKYIEDERINKITARHVLSHTSGFPNWAIMEPLSIQFEPGEKFEYSGEGITYLQHVIEKLTEKKLQWLGEELVFQPLQMLSSAFAPDYLHTLNRTYPYDEKGELVQDFIFPKDNNVIDYLQRMPLPDMAAGTMWASMKDYTTFLYNLQFNKKSRTKKILDLLTAEQIFFKKWNVSWGLGFGIQKQNGEIAFWHYGQDNGFNTFTINFLGKGGITIFTNGTQGARVYSEILKELLPEEPEFIKHNQK